jgi:hypothetical protein
MPKKKIEKYFARVRNLFRKSSISVASPNRTLSYEAPRSTASAPSNVVKFNYTRSFLFDHSRFVVDFEGARFLKYAKGHAYFVIPDPQRATAIPTGDLPRITGILNSYRDSMMSLSVGPDGKRTYLEGTPHKEYAAVIGQLEKALCEAEPDLLPKAPEFLCGESTRELYGHLFKSPSP